MATGETVLEPAVAVAAGEGVELPATTGEEIGVGVESTCEAWAGLETGLPAATGVADVEIVPGRAVLVAATARSDDAAAVLGGVARFGAAGTAGVTGGFDAGAARVSDFSLLQPATQREAATINTRQSAAPNIGERVETFAVRFVFIVPSTVAQIAAPPLR